MQRFIRVLVESFLGTFRVGYSVRTVILVITDSEAYDILAMTAVQTPGFSIGTVIVDNLHGLSPGDLLRRRVLQSGFEIP